MKFTVLFLFLSGCAGTFAGTCGVMPLGQTEQGIPVLKVHCEADK